MKDEKWSSFLSGDDKAYASIYNDYVREMFSYGMRFTSDRELVKDCIQDLFVKIYTNRSHLGQTDNIKLYLFISLKNKLYNEFQKNKVVYQVDTVEPVFSVDYTIEEQLIDEEKYNEKREKIFHFLELLPPRQKEVICYRYVDGLDLEEISQIMGMNYQSVQNLLQRSIKKIKSLLQTEEKRTDKIVRLRQG